MTDIAQDGRGAATNSTVPGFPPRRGFYYAKKSYNYVCSHLRAPPPADAEHDSQNDELHYVDLGSSSLQRMHTQEDEDEDGVVNSVVVDNGGFKCYKADTLEDQPMQPLPGSDSKAETSTINTDLEMNYVSGPDIRGMTRSAQRKIGWSRFLGWDRVRRFGDLSEKQKSLEDEYWRERWFSTKRLTFLGGLWLVLNWILAMCFARRPFNVMDNVYYYMISPVLVLPIPFMIMADMPSGGNSLLYQTWLCCAVWSSAIFSVLDGYLCGFFGSHAYFTCVDQDFFNIVYYACALPAIALFSMHQNRLPSLIGVIVFLTMVLILIVPHRGSFIRHVIDVGGFHCFFLYTNYSREQASRRVFTLKEQMKIQFRSKQRAQIAEKMEADSKRRLTNYIFHEVRIPLNTASLAFENIEASGIATKSLAIEFSALKGSLGMMGKVLGDILDFNRMDAGQLITVERPYHFHKTIKSMFFAASMVGESRGIKLDLDLDERIDIVARRAVLAHHGLPEAEIQKRLADPEYAHEGMVSGDEMRMRQVITNLISNALKFTTPGTGSRVTIRTKLLRPTSIDAMLGGGEEPSCSASTQTGGSQGASPDSTGMTPAQLEKLAAKTRRLDSVVVRIEVQDNGVGIRPKDMEENRLFSPFIQTEIGRTQGGKGTGLGLALVRQIVTLSGGRLGVTSQRGVGSTFWVEMRLGVGPRALREPSWPQIESGTPTAFGTELVNLIKGSYSSPSSSLRNTPHLANTDAVPTPSTFEVRTTSDYIGYHVDITNVESPSRRRSGEPGLTHTISEVTGVSLPSSEITPKAQVPPSTEPSPRALEKSVAKQDPLVLLPQNIEQNPAPLSSANTNSPEPAISPSKLRNSQRPTYISLPPQRLTTDPSSSLGTSTTFTTSSMAPLNSRHSRSDSSVTRVSLTPATPRSKIGDGMKVLVVDDDQLTRRLMSRMLERLGCQVDTAEDGQLAFNILMNGDPNIPASRLPPGLPSNERDTMSAPVLGGLTCETKGVPCYQVLFVDNQMPVMTGVELVTQLRQLGRKDFLIGVTGNAMTLDQREYLDAGADHVLTKPVREESIKEMLLRARSLSSDMSPLPAPSTPPAAAEMPKSLTKASLQTLPEVTTAI